MNSVKSNRSSWDKSIIKIGSSTLILVIFAGFLPSLYLYLVHGVTLSFSQMATAAVSVWIVYGAFYPIEPLTFYPSLGMAGTYMSWLAGSVGNMRVPSAVIAKDACNVKDGTREAEICTILAIAGSIVTNIIILTIGVLVGGQIINFLPEVVTNALNSYLLPGVFGGMFGMVGAKHLKISIPCFIVILLLCYLSNVKGLIPGWIVLFISVFGTIAFARIMYKSGKI